MCAELYDSARSWVIWPRVLQELIELDRQGLGSGIRLDELKDARLFFNEETRESEVARGKLRRSLLVVMYLYESRMTLYIYTHIQVFWSPEGSSQPHTGRRPCES